MSEVNHMNAIKYNLTLLVSALLLRSLVGGLLVPLALVNLYRRGFRRIIVANTRGHRFLANGLGRDSTGLIVDIFGSPGDYLASGLDGAEVFVTPEESVATATTV